VCAGIKQKKIQDTFGTLRGKHLFRTRQKRTNDILKNIYETQELPTIRENRVTFAFSWRLSF